MKKSTKLLSLIMLTMFVSCDFPGILGGFGDSEENDNTTNEEAVGGTENGEEQPEVVSWTKYIDKLTIEDTNYDNTKTIYEYTHDYDELNRINSIVRRISEDDYAETATFTFDYSTNNEIIISSTEDDAIARGIIGKNGLVKTIYKTEDNIRGAKRNVMLPFLCKSVCRFDK